MKTFIDLDFHSNSIGNGIIAKMEFPNGYGVSVIKGEGTYGGPHLYELAVLYGGELCYTTEITNDVIGWLTKDAVSELMIKVQML